MDVEELHRALGDWVAAEVTATRLTEEYFALRKRKGVRCDMFCSPDSELEPAVTIAA